MIGWGTAHDIVDLLDVDTVPACALCLLELAGAMHERRSSREIAAVLATTCDWIWLETGSEIEARIARLARRMADEMDSRDPPSRPAIVLPFGA